MVSVASEKTRLLLHQEEGLVKYLFEVTGTVHGRIMAKYTKIIDNDQVKEKKTLRKRPHSSIQDEKYEPQARKRQKTSPELIESEPQARKRQQTSPELIESDVDPDKENDEDNDNTIDNFFRFLQRLSSNVDELKGTVEQLEQKVHVFGQFFTNLQNLAN